MFYILRWSHPQGSPNQRIGELGGQTCVNAAQNWEESTTGKGIQGSSVTEQLPPPSSPRHVMPAFQRVLRSRLATRWICGLPIVVNFYHQTSWTPVTVTHAHQITSSQLTNITSRILGEQPIFPSSKEFVTFYKQDKWCSVVLLRSGFQVNLLW